MIRSVHLKDLAQIKEIEDVVEGEHAASYETLHSRHNLHQSGFFVNIGDTGVEAYLESIIWTAPDFSTFDDISDFSSLHNRRGNELYIIYLATEPQSRRQGKATALVNYALSYADRSGLDSIQLVAGEGFLPEFYRNLGFEEIETLPDFHAGMTGTRMKYFF